ncbi:hypothetical protein RND71_011459 [Anisodus tanguticus]|uniref:glucan endo-1,3-beta-D-glucosidase n=1 Tax=Anisodus tanguticus TaxID=243964 RepID=A0AAE1SDT2_9SOLA|nr:hypothetical protein RND71_011459 [Anisodus tanguticus]
MFHNPAFIYQNFIADITITALNNPNPNTPHVISSFDDLSVTLDLPSSNLRFFLVKGSPFITCNVVQNVALSISTIHAILECSSNSNRTKYTAKLNNGKTWVLYASSPIDLSHDVSAIRSSVFSGVIRIACLPNLDPTCEGILDRFKYNSIDGELVGVVGDSWILRSDPVSVTWHSIKGVKEEACFEIIDALNKDVASLDSKGISTTSSYFYGKLIARAARLALIAEEVCYLDVIPTIRKFLKDTVEPWLEGTFEANGFLYESKWGGIVTKQSAFDTGADFGFGSIMITIFILAISFMQLQRANSNYARLRCFDLWKLHSWAGGLTEFGDGRNQESTSEAVNAYYSAALMGLAYEDTHLVLPILPITELLFSDVQFAKQLVEWTMPALAREGVGEGWKGSVYTLEAIYDKVGALNKTRSLTGFDDGNSLLKILDPQPLVKHKVVLARLLQRIPQMSSMSRSMSTFS